MSLREVKCDHAMEHPKLHPVTEYVNIGNLIIGVCGTCYNALKGQILEGGFRDFFTEQTIDPMIIPTKLPPPRETRRFKKS